MEPTISNSSSEASNVYPTNQPNQYILAEQRIKDKRTQSQILKQNQQILAAHHGLGESTTTLNSTHSSSNSSNVLATIVPRCIVDYDSNFRHIKNTLGDAVTNHGRMIRKSLKLDKVAALAGPISQGNKTQTQSLSNPYQTQQIQQIMSSTQQNLQPLPVSLVPTSQTQTFKNNSSNLLNFPVTNADDCGIITNTQTAKLPLHSDIHLNKNHFLTKGTLPTDVPINVNEDDAYYITYGKVKKVKEIKNNAVRKFKNSIKNNSPISFSTHGRTRTTDINKQNGKSKSLSALDKAIIEKKIAGMEAYDREHAIDINNIDDHDVDELLDESVLKTCCVNMFKLLALIAITLLLVIMTAYFITFINAKKNDSGNVNHNNLFNNLGSGSKSGDSSNLNFLDSLDNTNNIFGGPGGLEEMEEEIITEIVMEDQVEKDILNEIEEIEQNEQKKDQHHNQNKSKKNFNKEGSIKQAEGGLGNPWGNSNAVNRAKRETTANSDVTTLEALKVSPCGNGQFKTSEGSCQNWLTCKDIKQQITFSKENLIGQGMTKMVYLAEYQGKAVVVSIRNKNNKDRWGDFKENIENLKKMQNIGGDGDNFNSENKAITLIGSCNDRILVTEYHKRGTLKELLANEEEYKQNFSTLPDRLNLLLEYVKSINFIHTFDSSPRVYCDSNKLDGTTKQFLLTDNNKLVMSDMDDIPLVKAENGDKASASCKHPEFLYNRQDILSEGFLAPEQKFGETQGQEFILGKDVAPKIDERSDIYKIADVAAHILLGGGNFDNPNTSIRRSSNISENDNNQKRSSLEEQAYNVLYESDHRLSNLLKACRSELPENRPSSERLINAIESVIESYQVEQSLEESSFDLL